MLHNSEAETLPQPCISPGPTRKFCRYLWALEATFEFVIDQKMGLSFFEEITKRLRAEALRSLDIAV